MCEKTLNNIEAANFSTNQPQPNSMYFVFSTSPLLSEGIILLLNYSEHIFLYIFLGTVFNNLPFLIYRHGIFLQLKI
jgi:hypothetical protein